MSEIDNVMLVATAEAKHAAEKVEGIEAQLRAAMRETYDHYMLRGESDQFMAAVAGVASLHDEETRVRIRAELDVLRAKSGVEMIAAVERVQELGGGFGLRTMWREITRGDQ